MKTQIEIETEIKELKERVEKIRDRHWVQTATDREMRSMDEDAEPYENEIRGLEWVLE